MKINTEIILALDPFFSFKENYLKFYKYFEGSLEDFFKLEKISFNYKIWVAVRLVDKNTRVKFAVKCAEFVLPIFEEKFKNDKRPRNCIELLNSIDHFDNLNDNQLELLRFHKNSASDAASDAADSDAASDATYSAAAAASAESASYSSYAEGAFSSATFAAYDAAYAAESNNNTFLTQSTIFQFLLDLTNLKKE